MGWHAFDEDKRMKKLQAILGMSIGGWLGCQIGALVSLFTAFIVSVIGAGVALYLVNRFGCLP